MKHHRFGGSTADRYINCAGSTALCATVPAKASSIYADEGSAAHALAAVCLQRDLHPTHFLGAPLPDWPEHVVTQEMCDAVVVYLNAVTHELAKTKDAEIFVEQAFELKIDGAEGEVGGTNDAMVYHPSTGRLVVFDYKHGVGVSVTAEDNAQLKFYAVGAVFSSERFQVTDLELVIVQPRARDAIDEGRGLGVKSWPMDPLDLMEFQGDVADAVMKAKAITGPPWDAGYDPAQGVQSKVFQTGSWCRWCDAAAICPQREREVLHAAQLDFKDITEISTDVLPDPKEFDTSRLGQILQAGKILGDWLNQIQEYVEGLVLSGVPVEGWKAVEKIGRAKWVSADADVAGYVDMMFGIDADQILPRKLVTITEAEKLLKAVGATKDQIDSFKLSYTIKESSGLTIAPASDRRPAVNALATDFASVNIDG